MNDKGEPVGLHMVYAHDEIVKEVTTRQRKRGALEGCIAEQGVELESWGGAEDEVEGEGGRNERVGPSCLCVVLGLGIA